MTTIEETVTQTVGSVESADYIQTLIWSVALPIAIVIGLKMGIINLWSYLKTLWVDGKSNEWVLIMNNGKMVKAGIGLRTWKGPFDQVATFPAKVYKVDFQTENVTNEMQGVRVKGMLVWTINRVGDGPF